MILKQQFKANGAATPEHTGKRAAPNIKCFFKQVQRHNITKAQDKLAKWNASQIIEADTLECLQLAGDHSDSLRLA